MLHSSIAIIISLYAIACLWLCWQWWRTPQRPLRSVAIPADFYLSVIVPVRNESLHIEALLHDLSKQTLSKKHIEIIVINDASTDDTEQIIRRFQQQNNLNLTLISLPDIAASAPKKRAITEALKIASGQLVVTTDGDCRVGEKWLETITQTYLQTKAKFISGPVTFLENNPSFFTRFQTIEFTSLIGTGACLLEFGKPTMCNGANLAYERSAFDEVGGYAGIDHIASGDDEFLLQKIHQHYPNSIYFLKNRAAIVYTHPQPTLRAFYQQRVRWGSKWAANRRVATMIVATFVFFVNLLTLWLMFKIASLGFQNQQLNAILGLKFVPEFLFLFLIIRFLGKGHLAWFIPIVQLFYPIYVLFFGVAAQRKGYEWKDRKLT